MATIPSESGADAEYGWAGARRDIQTVLYVLLHASGFLASTLLMTWGVLVFFFLAIGGFSVDGMMHQLNNLASRYVTADAERIASFKQIIFAGQILISLMAIYFRRHRILPARLMNWSQNNG